VLRYLVGRLYSHDEDDKWRAVRAIGFLVDQPDLVDHEATRELLRRFLWSMSDESGGVPFGIPEALGEVLARRPEFRDEFAPILGSMLTSEDMLQTGPIERGVVWALGRLGPAAAEYSPEAVEVLRDMAISHEDQRTRQVAADTLHAVTRDET